MSAARVQAELLQFEAALRPAYGQRVALRSASEDAWKACLSSLLSFVGILETSVLADGESGGAKWVQWRKSGASKQLIGLLRAAIEAAAAKPADSGSSVGAGSGITTDVAATQITMKLLHLLYKRTQRAALWPALREWLSEEPHQHGLQDLWRALAWILRALKQEIRNMHSAMTPIISSIDSVLQVSLSPTGLLLPRHLLQHPSLVAALRLVFGSTLPGLISFSPFMRPGSSEETLETSLSMLDGLIELFAQQQDAQLWDQLHPLALSLWTDAAAAVRRCTLHTDLNLLLQVRCYFFFLTVSCWRHQAEKLASHHSLFSFAPTSIATHRNSWSGCFCSR